MKAMLLAAGKGERMRPLTETCPKPLLTVGGKSLIAFHLEKLARCGIREVVVNHAWLGAQIETALGDGRDFGVHIRYSAEDEPLETAGGIVQALPLLGEEAFMVISSDIWTDLDFARLSQTRLESGILAHLVMAPNAPHHPTGDFILRDGRLELAGADSEAAACTYSGIGLYHPRLFTGLAAGFRPLRPVLETAIRQGQVSAELFQGDWHDIGSPARLKALDQELRNF